MISMGSLLRCGLGDARQWVGEEYIERSKWKHASSLKFNTISQ